MDLKLRQPITFTPWQVWAAALWGMARPLIVLSVVLVYLTGALMGHTHPDPLLTPAFWWGLAALLLVTLSIHYTNEYADVATDALTTRTRFSGGSGVLPSGIVPPKTALLAAWVTLLGGIGLAGAAVLLGRLPLLTLALLVVGAFFGWMYSLPPLTLAWRGWGELDNAVLGGAVLLMYGHSVQSPHLTLDLVLMTLPFTLLVFVNLLATTWADRQADASVGKRTLATRLPPHRLRWVYLGTLIAAFGLLVALPPLVASFSLLAVPLSMFGCATYTRWHTPAPTVLAMLVLLCGQMLAWAAL